MQHHTHAPRPALHMRGHHMPPMHATAGTVGNNAPAARMTAMNILPPRPQAQSQTIQSTIAPIRQNLIKTQTVPPQHQQKPPALQQQHHLHNSIKAPTAAQSMMPPNLREHHNRVNHQQQNQQTSLPSTTHMQKIRQQHQHINSNNNINKGNHQQIHHQYNHQPRMAAAQQVQSQTHIRHPTHHAHPQQQQQQLPQQQQQHGQYRMPNINNVNINKQPISNSNSQNHIQHTQPQPQPQPQYYTGNKPRFNNNNANNYTGQKQFSQNQYRFGKQRSQMASTSAEAPLGVAKMPNKKPDIPSTVNNNNNIIITPDATSSTAVVDCSETPNTAEDLQKTQEKIIVEEPQQQQPTQQQSPPPPTDNSDESNKENISLEGNQEPQNNNNINFTNNNHSNNNIINSNNINILSDDDTSPAKNSKEKTPMCLVNELARFNKITHQYRLTNEKGPPHCKRFQVTLKLGDEEYSAEGFKIKKAQHLAAAEAIEKTRYKHPIPKLSRRTEDGASARTNITPTVELNALAMKLGQQTYYLYDPRQMPGISPVDTILQQNDNVLPAFVTPLNPHNLAQAPHPRMLESSYLRRSFVPPPIPHTKQPRFNTRGYPKFTQRFPLVHNPHGAFPPPTLPCKITLIVGKQKFLGIGRTIQQAKHDAASRALQVLKAQATNELNEAMNTSLDEPDNKSPISVVHEIGIKRNMTVHFKVLREEGPAHMKNFITACIVGSIVTEGEGNGKKISKKRAAEKMFEELKKLPPLTPTKSPIKRVKVKTPGKTTTTISTPNSKGNGSEKRKRLAVKEKIETDNDDDNPITKLIQLQQNRKEKEPIFDLIAKNGTENSRRREFIIEVSAHGMVARGTGNNKKLAKRNAAKNLLAIMGENESESENEKIETMTNKLEFSKVTNTTSNVLSATANETVVDASKIKINDEPVKEIVENPDLPMVSTSAGQLPGILIVRQNKKPSKKKENALHTSEETKDTKADDPTSNEPVSKTTQPSENSIEKTVPNAAVIAPTVTTNNTTNSGSSVLLKDQLLYLAKLLGFE
ncbi:maternal effect protein staufen-like, partial [Teleopsis dalmanni]|uniref:maternal effect protein staufen-like n=1 Tax=Teleopsis dalmanni TaxID=139649 RepID=UPI0018CD81B8